MQAPIQEPIEAPIQTPEVMQTPEVIQANHDDLAILARLHKLKTLEDKSEYHTLATQYLQQHVAAFLEQHKAGDYHTFCNNKAFFLIHFPHLHVTNIDQVQQYYQEKKMSISMVRGHYGKIRVYLTHIHETKSTTLFEDVGEEYSKCGRNLSALHVHKSKENMLPTTIDDLLDKCNQMTVCKKNDGKIHLRIVVKDKQEHYKDVRMVYTMTPEEKKVLNWFTKTNPQHVGAASTGLAPRMA
ncbi:hypothetical protein AMAG_17070 [Allomyces macrogynus ATCC 38327]|uniref:Uncharacterized protein n=1 Tax=Allomyces macrogynus (strain ATCC 38327) TaxID=578462 RepID=A0A0L0TDJ1_ALLM3|nr:hypothetical protein AMAG_17070 [Allomyces macrogynus ATCC 38327]|eukprot:KNE72740.1 hypothetical protein AMAG_17070 [Allomyces macrogynus ATCC 38327]